MATKKRKPSAASKTRGKPRPSRRKTTGKKTSSAFAAASRKKKAALALRPEPGARQKPPQRPEQRQAFFADARHATDALAEELGEGFVLNATSGEDTEEFYEREREEEEGGPFLETSARTEFAYGVDESNPEDAEPAPWPAVSAGQPPPHRPGGPR